MENGPLMWPQGDVGMRWRELARRHLRACKPRGRYSEKLARWFHFVGCFHDSQKSERSNCLKACQTGVLCFDLRGACLKVLIHFPF